MCGIVAYIGKNDAFPIIINGLKRLEYRGYDSAGIILNFLGTFQVAKTKGKVIDLEKKAKLLPKNCLIGMGHTRWATHGIPSDINSHPHLSNDLSIALIHNGIIENYASIKKMLISEGFTFKSETDTEVLVNLIQYFKKKENLNLTESVRYALNEAIGAYAVAVMGLQESDTIIVGRLSSPLAIGIGNNEFFIASDASPFIEFTKKAVYLKDGEIATLKRGEMINVRKIIDNTKVIPAIQKLQLTLKEIEKKGYDYFMIKEIYEQPKSILETMRGRLLVKKRIIKMSGISNNLNKILNSQRILMISCGTSWHSALIGEYLIENFARIPVEVEYASEFRYRNPIINKNDIVIAISQSGETADTLAALKLAKKKGAFIYGICNVVGSSIARLTDAGSYTHAGPEIGVASTKAFTAQITILTMIALKLGHHNGKLSNKIFYKNCLELELVPKKIQKTLLLNNQIKELAKKFVNLTNFLYLGRGYNFPVALEGALKLKEISYIHAEGYPAAEMKHGPIALIDKNMPVVIIATKNDNYEKLINNIQEIKSRKGVIIAIVSEGDKEVIKIADYIIEIPKTPEFLSPLITTIPLQLLSYHIAVLRGVNVDQPRNLAKSVTVE